MSLVWTVAGHEGTAVACVVLLVASLAVQSRSLRAVIGAARVLGAPLARAVHAAAAPWGEKPHPAWSVAMHTIVEAARDGMIERERMAPPMRDENGMPLPFEAVRASKADTLRRRIGRVRRECNRAIAKDPEWMRTERAGVSATFDAVWITDAAATASQTGRTVLYLHGGGHIVGDLKSHGGFAARLARACGARVLFPLMRLAPECPFPAGLDDSVAAYRWLVEERGVPPASIAVAGDSAGGNLAAALLLVLRERGLPQPATTVLLSPWLDLECSHASWLENAGTDYLRHDPHNTVAHLYAAGRPLDSPLISPIRGDLAGLPPLLVHVGGHETLRDEGVAFSARAAKAGVDVTLRVWDGGCHVHTMFPMAPDAARAMEDIAKHVRGRVAAV